MKVTLMVTDGVSQRAVTDADEIIVPRGLPGAKVFLISNPAASGVEVVAVDSTGSSSSSGGAIPTPRSLDVTFPGTWDAGALVVHGTDQFGQRTSELFEADPGETVLGECVFASVDSVEIVEVGIDTADASIATGDALGFVGHTADNAALLFSNNTAEPATVDAAHSSIRPTTSPNGSTSYAFIANAL